MLEHSIISKLINIVGSENLIHDNEALSIYKQDGLSGYSGKPAAVALPNNEDQIIKILKLCNINNIPVVTRGSGTGLSGGAIPQKGAIVLSTSRLNKIISIDPKKRIAIVQPGVRNISVSEAAHVHKLFYAPDPSSQIACSIGGNVAENSGGVHCLKYGLTLHNVMRLRAINIEGEIFEAGSEAFDTPGYDLMSLLVGSEGMLAVVTEVTLRLIPKPTHAKVILASFDDIQKASDAVAGIIASGIIPAGLEMMDQPMTKAVEDFVNAGYDLDAKALLLCESDGTPSEVEEEITMLEKILTDFGSTEMRVSKDENERLLFWSGRKNAFPASGRISPDYYCIDGTIPRRKLGDMLSFISGLEKKYNLRCMNVFHAGDGNLHPLILFDSSKPNEFEETEKFGEEILLKCIEFGGTITGEHGVGLEKLGSMCSQFSAYERDTFFRLKSAFDPNHLLNPGKVIPTLARCAEKGRMHVHKGKISYPNISRF
ncbi:MAG: FAD-binding oxidoreductase [Betaproteobacteria bacterium TMED156]|nr:MAG: FAD-binding oxidoreductase [Betaproteobacteria bacterium TMED156]